MPKYKNIFSTITVLLLVTNVAYANERKWTGKHEVETFDCATNGTSKLIIDGTLKLVHPDDNDQFSPAKKIRIFCKNIHFNESSKLISDSAIDIRIDEVASGHIFIQSTRGIEGPVGKTTPDALADRVMDQGSTGGTGPGGRHAKCRWRGFKFISSSSTGGSTGGTGGRGAHGTTYVAPKGASGRTGASGADVILITRTFADGTTVNIKTEGGKGGKGGKGGTGATGGKGGTGGIGGRGGDAASCRTASHGGTGGTGGQGGNGGDGGPGGDGGNGGNGGDVRVFWQQGEQGTNPLIFNKGGLGGLPGDGGKPGEGGLGGDPGRGGCGGSGSSGVLGINPHGAGNCAGVGGRGQRGLRGKRGPLGQFGKDGEAGLRELPTTGPVPEDKINDLINNPS